MTKVRMDEFQAYQAIICFLEGIYFRTQSDDIGSLLGDMTINKDGKTMDPAIWEDWIKAVAKVAKDK